MEITLNRLPAKTWYRLKMNDTTVTIDEDFTSFTPQAQWNPEEVLWTEQTEYPAFGQAHGLSADVTAMTENAVVSLVETKPDQKMTGSVVLNYIYGPTASVSRLVLHAARGSTMNVVIALESQPETRASLQIVADAGADSTINLYMAQLMDHSALSLNEVGGTCGENAVVNLTRLELGGKKAYMGSNLDLRGAHSAFHADIAYHAREHQLLDMNYVAVHHGKATDSRMDASGTLEEHARKIFRGTIDFQHGCAGATGNENENVLLLGENMVNQTIPLILCKEEDVEGNHGASIGQLDARLLFYLGSRGISAEDANQMIARARIQSVCNRIPDETTRQKVETFENGEANEDDSELQS